MKKIEIKTSNTPTAKKIKPKSDVLTNFAFGRVNYTILIVGLAFIVVGFLLMIGGGSKNPNEFNYEIFNFRRLTLAPLLIIAGYIIEIWAIMKKPA